MARSRRSSKRASMYRRDTALWASKGTHPNLTYKQIQELMKRRLKVNDNSTEFELEQAVEEIRQEQECPTSVNWNLQQQEDQAAINYLHKRIVPVIGRVPKERAAGSWRLLLGNTNGLATRKSRNYKVDKLTAVTRDYDINIYAFQEVGLDTIDVSNHPNPSLLFYKLREPPSPQYLTTSTSPKYLLASKVGVLLLQVVKSVSTPR